MIILPDLPYRHGALEPVISATTLRTHHGKHHARYVEVTNALLGEAGETAVSLEDVVNRAWRRGARKLFNNAAQALNHGFYWTSHDPARIAACADPGTPGARGSRRRRRDPRDLPRGGRGTFRIRLGLADLA